MQYAPGDVNGDGKADLLCFSLDEDAVLHAVRLDGRLPGPHQLDLRLPRRADRDHVRAAVGSGRLQRERPDDVPRLVRAQVPQPDDACPVPGAGRHGPRDVRRLKLHREQHLQPRRNQTENRSCGLGELQLPVRRCADRLRGPRLAGVRPIAVLDETTGKLTTTTYNQDFPFTGTAASVAVEATPGYGDPRVTGNQALLMSLTSTTYASPSQRGRPAPRRRIPSTWSRSRPPSTRSTTTARRTSTTPRHTPTAYDDVQQPDGQHRFRLDQRRDQCVALPASVVYRYRQYINDTTNWVLGLLELREGQRELDRFRHRDVRHRRLQLALGHVRPRDLRHARRGDVERQRGRVPGDDVRLRRLRQPHVADQARRLRDALRLRADLQHVPHDDDDPRRRGGLVARRVLRLRPGVRRRGGPRRCQRQGLDLIARPLRANGAQPSAAHRSSGRVGHQRTCAGRDRHDRARKHVHQGGRGDKPRVRVSRRRQRRPVRPDERAADLPDRQRPRLPRLAGVRRRARANARDGAADRSADGRRRREADGLPRHRLQAGGRSAPVLLADGRGVRRSTRDPTTTYDVLGRPISRTVPAGADGNTPATTTTWTYGANQVVTSVEADGTTSAYTRLIAHKTFDGMRRVVEVTVVPAPTDPDTKAAVTRTPTTPSGECRRRPTRQRPQTSPASRRRRRSTRSTTGLPSTTPTRTRRATRTRSR